MVPYEHEGYCHPPFDWSRLCVVAGRFVVSFLFVGRTGQFIIPQPLFKSLMVEMVRRP
jgi:hypothetical protein